MKLILDLLKLHDGKSLQTSHAPHTLTHFYTQYLKLLPYSLSLAGTKLQHGSAQYSTERLVKSFEIVNNLKKSLSECNEEDIALRVMQDLLTR
jgi:hypothetical protein